MKKTILFLAGVLVLGALAGCASTDTKTTASNSKASSTSSGTETAKKEEYVRYTPTGSWITRKVKKSEVEATGTESDEAARAMGELQRKGNRVPAETGG